MSIAPDRNSNLIMNVVVEGLLRRRCGEFEKYSLEKRTMEAEAALDAARVREASLRKFRSEVLTGTERTIKARLALSDSAVARAEAVAARFEARTQDLEASLATQRAQNAELVARLEEREQELASLSDVHAASANVAAEEADRRLARALSQERARHHDALAASTATSAESRESAIVRERARFLRSESAAAGHSARCEPGAAAGRNALILTLTLTLAPNP